VREPDKAGERSATGLNEDNSSICMDCHNWQYEVQGTKPVHAPQKDLEAHGAPSHPQRETLRGYVMYGVEERGEFMPGAECEDCHMPKTNKAANRISHGMKPMLPGDAETWMTAAGTAYMGEDSCSKCHGGASRSDLQNMVNLWQGEAADTATAVSNSIAKAEKRKEFSWKNTKSAGYILVGHATWNYKAYENDASGSAHNPDYIVEGLWRALVMADSVGGSFKTIVAGKGVISGLIVNGDNSPAIDGQLKLYKNGKLTQQWAESDYKGGFAIPVKGKGNYAVKWQRAGEKQTWLYSPVVVVK
jgi:formate-dependent nitrite reductase cytochrome c552 subunit